MAIVAKGDLVAQQGYIDVEVVDAGGRKAQISQAGELVTGGKYDDISINFQYGLRTADIRSGGFVSGTGAVGSVGAMVYAETGTGIGSATLESIDSVRYRSGHMCYCDPSVIMPTPETGVNIYIGFLNNIDGLCWGYQGTELGFWFISGGNVSFIARSEWDDPLDGTGISGHILNPQAPQIPEIKFTWHGFKSITFGFDDGDGNIIPAHKLNFINDPTVTGTHLKNPSLPMSMKIERLAGTGANLRVQTGSWRGGKIALQDEKNTATYWPNVTALDVPLVSGARTIVAAIQNKATYGGKVNHIRVELAVVAFSNSGNKSVAIYGNKGGTPSAAMTFTDVDTVNSCLSYSKGTGQTITGGGRGAATILRAGQDRRSDVLGTGIYIYPGETLYIEVDPGGAVNGSFSTSIRIAEYH
jgi:hypothetical protein